MALVYMNNYIEDTDRYINNYIEDTDRYINNYIEYTDRYLSKYWLVILHYTCIELESKYLGTIKPRIVLNKPWDEGKHDSFNKIDSCIKQQAKILLDYFEEILTYNKKDKLLHYSDFYVHENIFFIPITKADKYDTIHWYSSNLTGNINSAAIVLQYNNCKFTNIGIHNFPKENYLPQNNEMPEGIRLMPEGIRLMPEGIRLMPEGINANIKVKSYIHRELEKNKFSCWYSKDHQIQHNITNINSDEVNCLNNGGVWDTPCITNIDCPYGKCLPDGFCEVPHNLERIGYTYYNG